MTAQMPTGPLMTAAQIQGMAGKADEKTAKILTGLSVAVLLMTLVREGWDMFLGDSKGQSRGQSWQQHELERRTEMEASWRR